MYRIQKDLLNLKDKSNIDFIIKLTPGLDKNKVLGIKTPILRKYVNKIKGSKEEKEFIKTLPHIFHDENMLHALLLNEYDDFNKFKTDLIKFLPYINNWMVSDLLSPKKIFKKYKKEFLSLLLDLLKSNETYTLRVAIKLLMNFYLDEDFKEEYIKRVASIKSDEYYVNMAVSWFICECLIKHFDVTIKYIENHKLNKFSHNKSIQKAVESFRISNDKKIYLKSLKIKEN